MKLIFYSLLTLAVLASCSSTKKDYLSRPDEDRTLFDVVKALSKHPNDSNAIKALPVLYPIAQTRHLDKISRYKNESGLNTLDKIVDEYTVLQKMYDVITADATSSRLVSPTNYQNQLYDAKQQAADEYYSEGLAMLDKEGRDNAKRAWTYFSKADKFIPGFKDAKAKMDEAYQNAIVNVVINPVTDNSFYFNTGWGNAGYNYSHEYFQQTMIRELGGTNATRYPARFYSDWDARRENIKPDWVIDLTLRYLDIPRPASYNYVRTSTKSVEAGKDTSGHTIYQSVSATVSITRMSFTARGQMQVEITDVASRKIISNHTYSDDYSWQEEHADYSGDSRALSQSDWDMLSNRRYYDQPTKEDVLSEWYRRLYTQVKI